MSQKRSMKFRSKNEEGFCLCGCGERTPVARYNNIRLGWVAGEPIKYINGHNRRKKAPEYTVDLVTGCWLWNGACEKGGYGRKQYKGNSRPAHKVYYEKAYGPVPPGMELDHLCRTRNCVNPAHLEPVSRAENVRRGNCTKLTKMKVLSIKCSLVIGDKVKDIAMRNGVAASTIKDILYERTWKNV
jgi:hypothetical protein